MRRALSAGLTVLAVALSGTAAFAQPHAPKGPLNTMAEIRQALRGCWEWPPLSESRTGMALTVRVSFRRDGRLLGARVTYQSRDVSEEERSLYIGAVIAALRRCSPMPFSPGLGGAIAGRPMTFHIHDTRQQRKA